MGAAPKPAPKPRIVPRPAPEPAPKPALVCRDTLVSSNGYKPAQTLLSETKYGKIMTFKIKKQVSNTRCVLNQNYGVKGNTIWVDKGCRAYFTSCHGKPVAKPAPKPALVCRDTLVSPNGYKPAQTLLSEE